MVPKQKIVHGEAGARVTRTPRRRVVAAGVLIAAIVAVAALAPRAHAVTFGSDLSKPANLPFDCGVRPYPGQYIQTGTRTCTWWSAPLTPANTYVPVGEGRITGVRVRSGANPAPLRVTILSSGGGLCCTSRSQSAIFQPTPNAVTSVALDLPAGGGGDVNRPGSQYNDIVAISVVGPGTLPVHDTGSHGTFDTTGPAASFLHPEPTVGASNTDVGWMDGYEVLVQADWCGTPGIPARRGGPVAGAAQACPTAPAPPANTPQQPPAAQPPPPQQPPVQPPPAAPALSGLRVGGSGRTLALTISAPTTVTARLARCVVRRRPRRRTVCTTVATLTARPTAAGELRLGIPRRVRAGRYRVTVTASGSDAKLVKDLSVAAGPRAGRRRRGRR